MTAGFSKSVLCRLGAWHNQQRSWRQLIGLAIMQLHNSESGLACDGARAACPAQPSSAGCKRLVLLNDMPVTSMSQLSQFARLTIAMGLCGHSKHELDSCADQAVLECLMLKHLVAIAAFSLSLQNFEFCSARVSSLDSPK